MPTNIAEARRRSTVEFAGEEDRLPVVRALVGVALLAGPVGRRTRSSSRSSSPRRSRTSAPTAPTSASTTSPSSSRRRSRSWRRSALAPSASRSGPPSSTCATRTRSTWSRTPAPPTSSPAVACSSGSAAARPSRSSMASATSATCRPTARPTPTWPASTPRSSSRPCRAPGSPSPTPRRCSRTRPGCFAPSRIRPGCATGSGGAPDHARPRNGPAQQGMNLMSSTLLTEDAGVPFHELQAEQIRLFREAWTAAGHEREPRVSVSRSIFALVDDRDRAYFGRGNQDVGSGRLHRRADQGDLRAFVRRGARRPRQGARRGHGDPGGGHAPADGPEPARRRVQRPRDREHPQVRGPGARLALADGRSALEAVTRSSIRAWSRTPARVPAGCGRRG